MTLITQKSKMQNEISGTENVEVYNVGESGGRGQSVNRILSGMSVRQIPVFKKSDRR